MRGTFRRLLGLTAPFGRWMALAVLLGVATILSSVGLMTTSAYIIAKAALRPSIADLQLAIVGVRFFGIARGGFRYLERYVSHQATFRILARIRVWFYAALEPLAPARLQEYRSGDLLARIVADVETLQDFFLRVLAPPVVALLVTAVVVFFVGRFDPLLAGVLLLFLVLAGVALPILTRALSRPLGRQMIQLRSDLNIALVDGIQGVADLLAFGQEGSWRERVRELSQEFGWVQRRMARIQGLHGALSGLLMNLATIAILIVAIPLVRGGALDGVFLALLVLAVISSFEAVLPLPQAFQHLEASLEAARRLFEIVDAQPAVVDRPSPATVPRPAPLLSPDPGALVHKSTSATPHFPDPGSRIPDPGSRFTNYAPDPILETPDRYDIRVNNLSFSYHPDSPLVLDGISFDLPEGHRLAAVGPSGAGKTTLTRLLLRFWEASSGQILLGGRDLREVNQEAVRRLLAVVSQGTHLFSATVRENLLLARPDADEADLVRAARQAQIHDFFDSLPQGYDTWIGERGVRLSAGQRQRLAIARALLKDAPIWILDEPTANLDALTERSVMETLASLMTGRTVLVVTHRLAGLDAADEILVLRSGRIAERGRHHELIARGGLYRRMWDLEQEVLALNP